MEAVFALALALLTMLNWLRGKSLFYPPVIYCGFWAVLLFGLVVSGEFYPVSSVTLLIFLLGAAAFSVGALFISKPSAAANVPPPAAQDALVGRALNAGLLALLVILPFFWARVEALSEASGTGDFWVGLRYQTSVVEDAEGFGAYYYVCGFASFLALAAAVSDGFSRANRWRTLAIVGVALAYQFLTAGRLGSYFLLFGMLGVAGLQRGKITVRAAVLSVMAAVAVFCSLAILLNKGGNKDADLNENVASLTGEMQLYLLGGSVAFDQYVQELSQPGENTSLRTARFFYAVARSLGVDCTVPSLVMDYSPTPRLSNVYTIYYTYYSDFGFAGVLALLPVMGALATWVYQKASEHSRFFCVLYGESFAMILLSGADEYVFSCLSSRLQILLYAYLLFELPRLVKRPHLPRAPAKFLEASAP